MCSFLYNSSTICEICGKNICSENLGSNYNIVRITHDKGQRWEGDRNTESLNVRVCGECFETKVLPFLKELGVHTEYTDTSDASICD